MAKMKDEADRLLIAFLKASKEKGMFVGEWIPVSERLPEDFQRVLVTIVRYNGDKIVRVAEYYDKKKFFQIKENDEQWEVGEKGLLAWMPLPEPYKEVENDTETTNKG